MQCPEIVLSALPALWSLTFTRNFEVATSKHHYFTDEQTEAQKVKQFALCNILSDRTGIMKL